MKQKNEVLAVDEVISGRIQFEDSEANGLQDRLIRLGGVMELIGLKKSALYALVKKGTFPAPYRLGPNSVGWKRSEVVRWINGLHRTNELN